MFAHVSSVVAQVKGTSLDVLFGGMAVLLVLGDFFQDELMGKLRAAALRTHSTPSSWNAYGQRGGSHSTIKR
jgi:hypothetical protein